MSAEQAQGQEAAWTPELTPPPGITSNLDRYYWVRHQAMMNLYHNGEEEKAVEAAEELLLDAELPFLYRARCHMVLSTNDDHPLFLQHANEAVRLLDEDIRGVVEPEAFPTVQYEEALRLQQAAQEATTEGMAAFEARKSEDEEEVDVSAGIDEGQEETGGGGGGEEEMGEGEGLAEAGQTSAAAPAQSVATQRLLREATSFGTTSRHGLITPGTSRTASTRTASNQSQGRGGAPSRGSSRLASGNTYLTPHREEEPGQE